MKLESLRMALLVAQTVVRGEMLKGNELLRHLWGCFPLTSTSRQAKADRLLQALSQVYDSLRRMQECVPLTIMPQFLLKASCTLTGDAGTPCFKKCS